MADLGEKIEEIEGLKDKSFTILGLSMTPTTIGAAFALLSAVIGALYGGFVLYQKVEEVANLDLAEYSQQMKVMDAKVTEAVDYARDIKTGLKGDILRVEQQTDRVENMVRNANETTRQMIDKADARFEDKRDQMRVSNKQDLKELEDRLNAKLQRALDNPLAK